MAAGRAAGYAAPMSRHSIAEAKERFPHRIGRALEAGTTASPLPRPQQPGA
ncbi:MAG: hypothetical protein AVDCRST_MAG27-32 [uncultured Craurococcus sp.]|uniref:Uncharacterized protein n=1 Tax=uncultured Craurococcus sp. TaxID=1135998 RepID=A0A6J4H5R9_9PROT|nr:MAG: hypothetical protein AVDCRST_MAG27-32 [uncultured Craurococcus sp.]